LFRDEVEEQYGIVFGAPGDFPMSQQGYAFMKDWMAFLKERLPRYNQYLSTINLGYLKTPEGKVTPTVIAHADWRSELWN
jgi:hypothetical protein